MGIFKTLNKKPLNVTVDLGLHAMLKEVMKEFKLKNISRTANEVLDHFKQTVWDVPEEKKKLVVESEEEEETSG